MLTPTVIETTHLSAHASVPVVVTCLGHVVTSVGLPPQPAPKRGDLVGPAPLL
jgi:hypothetical protein